MCNSIDLSLLIYIDYISYLGPNTLNSKLFYRFITNFFKEKIENACKIIAKYMKNYKISFISIQINVRNQYLQKYSDIFINYKRSAAKN